MNTEEKHSPLAFTGDRRDRAMRKAEALGFETRNVSSGWLAPLKLRSRSPEHTQHQLTTGSVSPSYSPRQSPKGMQAIRTARMLQGMGQLAIYSKSPYVDTAMESLVVPVWPQANPSTATAPSSPNRYTTSLERRFVGKLPKKGSKAAAIARAKRLVSQGAAFASEVPFSDALRVCDLESDQMALKKLLHTYILSKPRISLTQLEYYISVLALTSPRQQARASTLFMQQGYYFAALKVVYADHELLGAALDEIKLVLTQGLEEGSWDVGAATWIWHEDDRSLLLKQFSDLRIISHYLDVRRKLRALHGQGVVALARVEKELLLKVVNDFLTQLPPRPPPCTEVHMDKPASSPSAPTQATMAAAMMTATQRQGAAKDKAPAVAALEVASTKGHVPGMIKGSTVTAEGEITLEEKLDTSDNYAEEQTHLSSSMQADSDADGYPDDFEVAAADALAAEEEAESVGRSSRESEYADGFEQIEGNSPESAALAHEVEEYADDFEQSTAATPEPCTDTTTTAQDVVVPNRLGETALQQDLPVALPDVAVMGRGELAADTLGLDDDAMSNEQVDDAAAPASLQSVADEMPGKSEHGSTTASDSDANTQDSSKRFAASEGNAKTQSPTIDQVALVPKAAVESAAAGHMSGIMPDLGQPPAAAASHASLIVPSKSPASALPQPHAGGRDSIADLVDELVADVDQTGLHSTPTQPDIVTTCKPDEHHLTQQALRTSQAEVYQAKQMNDAEKSMPPHGLSTADEMQPLQAGDQSGPVETGKHAALQISAAGTTVELSPDAAEVETAITAQTLPDTTPNFEAEMQPEHEQASQALSSAQPPQAQISVPETQKAAESKQMLRNEDEHGTASGAEPHTRHDQDLRAKNTPESSKIQIVTEHSSPSSPEHELQAQDPAKVGDSVVVTKTAQHDGTPEAGQAAQVDAHSAKTPQAASPQQVADSQQESRATDTVGAGQPTLLAEETDITKQIVAGQVAQPEAEQAVVEPAIQSEQTVHGPHHDAPICEAAASLGLHQAENAHLPALSSGQSEAGNQQQPQDGPAMAAQLHSSISNSSESEQGNTNLTKQQLADTGRSRPLSGAERDGVADGIKEMRQVMAESRRRISETSEKLRASLNGLASPRAPSPRVGALPPVLPLDTSAQEQAKAVKEAEQLAEAQKELERALLQSATSTGRTPADILHASKDALQEQIARTLHLFQQELSQSRLGGEISSAGVASTIPAVADGNAAAPRSSNTTAGAPGSYLAGESSKASGLGADIQLPPELDEPPSQEEVVEYAKYLGMDVDADADLLYIAEWALTAALPEGWTVHLDNEGNEFFFNAITNASTYEHPMDDYYKKYYAKLKAEKADKAT